MCCELLSNCDFTIFDTTWMLRVLKHEGVVNCFQIVILRSLTQHQGYNKIYYICCELLSNCDFTIFDTTRTLGSVYQRSL